jgi:hypothetical protein
MRHVLILMARFWFDAVLMVVAPQYYMGTRERWIGVYLGSYGIGDEDDLDGGCGCECADGLSSPRVYSAWTA